MSKHLNKKGLLLVEALLAIVILSISLTLIVQSMISSYRATMYQADFTRAVFLLENQISHVLLRDGLTADERLEGQWEPPDHKFTYSVEAKAYDPGETSLHTISAWVDWSSGRKTNRVGLTTLGVDQSF